MHMQAKQSINPASWRIAITIAAFRLWCQRAVTRRALRDLDARYLADVGLTERDRAAECAKWFWQE
jgi:uncharacterized protein YjiS (DUF1127 family)